MRVFIALLLSLCALAAQAQNWEDRRLFNEGSSGTTMTILSSTDTALFAPVIESFVAENPSLSIEYLVASTAQIDDRFRAAPERFDLVISSAMDLQLKLANDGLAHEVRGIPLPDWAQWRARLFAFTAEPAAIVINRAAFEGLRIPESRQDLIEALRSEPERFQGKVGTYDIRQSGLGYLFATQDARTSETYWRLMEVMGGLAAALNCCSGAMIDDLTDGTIAVAYNVLGSYASARIEGRDALKIILPSDFPTTMMRTALVSDEGEEPDIAELFLRHLIAGRASDMLPLPALDPQDTGAERSMIALEPALLTFLDALKRNKFVSEWEDAVIQD